MEYEESWCCMEAEQDTIWDKAFLYKRNTPHKSTFKEAPDISHLHEDWWMFDHIPF